VLALALDRFDRVLPAAPQLVAAEQELPRPSSAIATQAPKVYQTIANWPIIVFFPLQSTLKRDVTRASTELSHLLK
jgi:hypothetical protein